MVGPLKISTAEGLPSLNIWNEKNEKWKMKCLLEVLDKVLLQQKPKSNECIQCLESSIKHGSLPFLFVTKLLSMLYIHDFMIGLLSYFNRMVLFDSLHYWFTRSFPVTGVISFLILWCCPSWWSNLLLDLKRQRYDIPVFCKCVAWRLSTFLFSIFWGLYYISYLLYVWQQ